MVVNFKTWLISWLVPDDLWGIYIGDLCEIHDEDYAKGGSEIDRSLADTKFRDRIAIRVYNKLLRNGIKWKKANKKATLAATIYYIGVDLGGKEHFNYNKEK